MLFLPLIASRARSTLFQLRDCDLYFNDAEMRFKGLGLVGAGLKGVKSDCFAAIPHISTLCEAEN